MTCPRCEIPLNEITKTGVLVDVCDQCRGVWPDRGELEKIAQRLRALERHWDERASDDERPAWRGSGDDRPYPRKRRWTEMFDIFD
jgi:Zn-finger nucleic acid-binding protein